MNDIQKGRTIYKLESEIKSWEGIIKHCKNKIDESGLPAIDYTFYNTRKNIAESSLQATLKLKRKFIRSHGITPSLKKNFIDDVTWDEALKRLAANKETKTNEIS